MQVHACTMVIRIFEVVIYLNPPGGKYCTHTLFPSIIISIYRFDLAYPYTNPPYIYIGKQNTVGYTKYLAARLYIGEN